MASLRSNTIPEEIEARIFDFNFFGRKNKYFSNRSNTNKFSYHMNLRSTTLNPYDVIYFLILNSYIVPLYGEKNNEQFSYICRNIDNLSPDEKDEISALILFYIGNKFFFQFINYKYYNITPSGLTEEMEKVKYMIKILKKLGTNYFSLLRYIREIIKKFIFIRCTKEVKQTYEHRIQFYIKYMKDNFGNTSIGNIMNINQKTLGSNTPSRKVASSNKNNINDKK